MSNIIEVNLKKNIQPVRIWGLDFEMKEGQKFRMQMIEDAQRAVKFQAKAETDRLNAIEKQDLKALKTIENNLSKETKAITDSMFGEGAYDKLCAIEDDSDFILEAVTEVVEKYVDLQTQEQGNTYLTGKKG